MYRHTKPDGNTVRVHVVVKFWEPPFLDTHQSVSHDLSTFGHVATKKFYPNPDNPASRLERSDFLTLDF